MPSKGARQILDEMSANKRKQFRKGVINGWDNSDLVEVFNMTNNQVCSIKIMMGISSKDKTVTRKGKYIKSVAKAGPQQRVRICITHDCNTEFISEHFGIRMCCKHRKEHVTRALE